MQSTTQFDQNAVSATLVVFFAFDILVSAGKDVKSYPLRDRKALLRLAFKSTDLAQLPEHLNSSLSKFLQGIRQIGGEGVVAKRLDSRYEPGRRSGAWSKIRINVGQEFVIGGFTLGSNGIEALVVGYYADRKLIYAARVNAINDKGRVDFRGIKSRNQSSTSVQKSTAKRANHSTSLWICAPSPRSSFS